MSKINGQLTFVNSGGIEGATIKWCKATFTIGSHDDCDICILSELIDSKHCILKLVKDQQASITHIGSNQYKTILENVEIAKSQILNHNSVFIVGKSFIRFQYPQTSKWYKKDENDIVKAQLQPQIPNSIAMSTPKHPMYSIHCHRTNSPTVSPITFSNTKISTVLPVKRLNVRPFVTPIQNKSINKRKSKIDIMKSLKSVSFGPNLSPEQFDQEMPPAQPIKKGATPMITPNDKTDSGKKINKRRFSIVSRGSSLGNTKNKIYSVSSFSLSDNESINDSFTDKAMAKARKSNAHSPINYIVPLKQRKSVDMYEYSLENEKLTEKKILEQSISIRSEFSQNGIGRSIDTNESSVNLDNIRAMEIEQNTKISKIINRNSKEIDYPLSNNLTKFRQLIRSSRSTNSALHTDCINPIVTEDYNTIINRNSSQYSTNIAIVPEIRQSINLLQGISELFDVPDNLQQSRGHGDDKSSLLYQGIDKKLAVSSKSLLSDQENTDASNERQSKVYRRSSTPRKSFATEEKQEIDLDAGEFMENKIEISAKSKPGRKSRMSNTLRKSIVPEATNILQMDEMELETQELSDNHLELSSGSKRGRKPKISFASRKSIVSRISERPDRKSRISAMSIKSVKDETIPYEDEQENIYQKTDESSQNPLEISTGSKRGRKSKISFASRESIVTDDANVLEMDEVEREPEESSENHLELPSGSKRGRKPKISFASRKSIISRNSDRPDRKSRISTMSRKSVKDETIPYEDEQENIYQETDESSANRLELSSGSKRGRKPKISFAPGKSIVTNDANVLEMDEVEREPEESSENHLELSLGSKRGRKPKISFASRKSIVSRNSDRPDRKSRISTMSKKSVKDETIPYGDEQEYIYQETDESSQNSLEISTGSKRGRKPKISFASRKSIVSRISDRPDRKSRISTMSIKSVKDETIPYEDEQENIYQETDESSQNPLEISTGSKRGRKSKISFASRKSIVTNDANVLEMDEVERELEESSENHLELSSGSKRGRKPKISVESRKSIVPEAASVFEVDDVEREPEESSNNHLELSSGSKRGRKSKISFASRKSIVSRISDRPDRKSRISTMSRKSVKIETIPYEDEQEYIYQETDESSQNPLEISTGSKRGRKSKISLTSRKSIVTDDSNVLEMDEVEREPEESSENRLELSSGSKRGRKPKISVESRKSIVPEAASVFEVDDVEREPEESSNNHLELSSGSKRGRKSKISFASRKSIVSRISDRPDRKSRISTMSRKSVKIETIPYEDEQEYIYQETDESSQNPLEISTGSKRGRKSKISLTSRKSIVTDDSNVLEMDEVEREPEESSENHLELSSGSKRGRKPKISFASRKSIISRNSDRPDRKSRISTMSRKSVKDETIPYEDEQENIYQETDESSQNPLEISTGSKRGRKSKISFASRESIVTDDANVLEMDDVEREPEESSNNHLELSSGSKRGRKPKISVESRKSIVPEAASVFEVDDVEREPEESSNNHLELFSGSKRGRKSKISFASRESIVTNKANVLEMDEVERELEESSENHLELSSGSKRGRKPKISVESRKSIVTNDANVFEVDDVEREPEESSNNHLELSSGSKRGRKSKISFASRKSIVSRISDRPDRKSRISTMSRKSVKDVTIPYEDEQENIYQETDESSQNPLEISTGSKRGRKSKISFASRKSIVTDDSNVLEMDEVEREPEESSENYLELSSGSKRGRKPKISFASRKSIISRNSDRPDRKSRISTMSRKSVKDVTIPYEDEQENIYQETDESSQNPLEISTGSKRGRKSKISFASRESIVTDDANVLEMDEVEREPEESSNNHLELSTGSKRGRKPKISFASRKSIVSRISDRPDRKSRISTMSRKSVKDETIPYEDEQEKTDQESEELSANELEISTGSKRGRKPKISVVSRQSIVPEAANVLEINEVEGENDESSHNYLEISTGSKRVRKSKISFASRKSIISRNSERPDRKSRISTMSRKSVKDETIPYEDEQEYIYQETDESSQNPLEISTGSKRGRKPKISVVSRKSIVPEAASVFEVDVVEQEPEESSNNHLDLSSGSKRGRKSNISRKSIFPKAANVSEMDQLEREPQSLNNQLENSSGSKRGRKPKISVVSRKSLVLETTNILQMDEVEREPEESSNNQLEISTGLKRDRMSKISNAFIVSPVVQSENKTGESPENFLEISQKSKRGRKSKIVIESIVPNVAIELDEIKHDIEQPSDNELEISKKSMLTRKSIMSNLSRKSIVHEAIQSKNNDQIGESSGNILKISQKSKLTRKSILSTVSRKSTVSEAMQPESDQEKDQEARENSENLLEISQKIRPERKSRISSVSKRSFVPEIIQMEEEVEEKEVEESPIDRLEKSTKLRPGNKSTMSIITKKSMLLQTITFEDVQLRKSKVSVESRNSIVPEIVELNQNPRESLQNVPETITTLEHREINHENLQLFHGKVLPSEVIRKSIQQTTELELNVDSSTINLIESKKLTKGKRPYNYKQNQPATKRLLRSKQNTAECTEITPVEIAVNVNNSVEPQKGKTTRGRPKNVKQLIGETNNENVGEINIINQNNNINTSIGNNQVNSSFLENMEKSLVEVKKKTYGRQKKHVSESVDEIYNEENNSILENLEQSLVEVKKKTRGRQKKRVSESLDEPSALKSEINNNLYSVSIVNNETNNSVHENLDKNSVVITKTTRGRPIKRAIKGVIAQNPLASKIDNSSGSILNGNSEINKKTRGRQKKRVSESVDAQSALESEMNNSPNSILNGNGDDDSVVKKNSVEIIKKTRGRQKKRVSESVDAQSALESEMNNSPDSILNGNGDDDSVVKKNSVEIIKKTRGRQKKRVSESVDAQSALESEMNNSPDSILNGNGDDDSVVKKNSVEINKKTRGRQKKSIIKIAKETSEPETSKFEFNQLITVKRGLNKEKVDGKNDQQGIKDLVAIHSESENSLPFRQTRARKNTVKSNDSKLINDENISDTDKIENVIPIKPRGRQKKLIANEFSEYNAIGASASKIAEEDVLENTKVDEFKKPFTSLKRSYKKKNNQNNSSESYSTTESVTFESTQEDTDNKSKKRGRKKNIVESDKNSTDKENVNSTEVIMKNPRSAAKKLENQSKLSDSEVKRGQSKISDNSEISDIIPIKMSRILKENKNTENSEISGIQTRTRSRKM